MADIPGWPFLTPPRIQMQKCDKCSREFCATINYRRHMRIHRRNLNIDKDSTTKNRSLLQAFWDKLSVEEAMEIMSFKDVSLEGVPGSSIVKELMSLILKPRCTSLPMSYLKAGSALLDIIQARPSRFPISSSDLFSILDEASEKTFLCAGTAGSLQKYVFDGDAGKIGVEMRNLFACTSFLIEQKLVKACLADKDTEALRYQKLLVEEEEAAWRRRAALLEKKRLKKLRLKEQRAKELASVESDDSPADNSPSPPVPSPVDVPDCNPDMSEIPHSPTSSLEPNQIVNPDDVEKDTENGYPDFSTYQNVEHRTLHRSGRRRVVDSHWQAPRMQRSANGFHTYHNYLTARPGASQKHVPHRDVRIENAANGSKVWAPKTKSETEEESHSTSSLIRAENLPVEDKKREVLIGSISVTLENCRSKQQDQNICGTSEGRALELPVPPENGIYEKPNKIETVQNYANRSVVKIWKPVSGHENGAQLSSGNCSEASKVPVFPCNGNGEVHLAYSADSDASDCGYLIDTSIENGHQVCLTFSGHVAEAFLTKRWKEAISSDHVEVVMYPESKPPEVLDDIQEVIPLTRLNHHSLLRSTENQLLTCESSTVIKSKMKYIPKQRSLT